MMLHMSTLRRSSPIVIASVRTYGALLTIVALCALLFIFVHPRSLLLLPGMEAPLSAVELAHNLDYFEFPNGAIPGDTGQKNSGIENPEETEQLAREARKNQLAELKRILELQRLTDTEQRIEEEGSTIRGCCGFGAAPLAPSLSSRNDGAAELAKIRERGLALGALPLGKVVVRGPRGMRVGETRTVAAAVGLNVSVDKLLDPSSNDQVLPGSAHLSADMAALLTGAGFNIKPMSAEKQTLAEGFLTQWVWNVEALQPGEQQLSMALFAFLPGRGEVARQQVETYVERIVVGVKEATWSEWFEQLGKEFDTAKTAVLGLVGGATVVIGWIGFLRNRRKNKLASS
jgi:hypothetical protein